MNHLKALARILVGLIACSFVLGLLHFPYDTDSSLTEPQKEAARKYYIGLMEKTPYSENNPSAYEAALSQVGAMVEEETRSEAEIEAFVARYNLQDRPVLEIGSGSGRLQDAARDYTGLDISPKAARFYHKK